SPPNSPPPNSMPSSPAPRNPAASPPSRPGRLKNPPPGVPNPGLPGWVMVRLKGCAVFGAVDVLGGAENVRPPREPELSPPPTRASADETAIASGSASDRTTATICTIPRVRVVNLMTISSGPGTGEINGPNMGRVAQKGSG